MILAFNRPKALNAMTPTMAEDIKRILDWFDEEPSLWCVLSMRKGGFNLKQDCLGWSSLQDKDVCSVLVPISLRRLFQWASRNSI